MKGIVFIGVAKSGSSREAIRAAESLGYYTILLTNNEKQLQQRREYPDVHQMVLVDITNIEEIKKALRKLQKSQIFITSIMSFTDPYVQTATRLCAEFCHCVSQPDAIAIMENKEKTRATLQQYDFTPKFAVIPPGESVEKPAFLFPIIVKSPHSTGSKDVLLALNQKQLTKHIDTLRERYPASPLMLEEYIDGPQYLVETVVTDGIARIIAVIEQDIDHKKRFIITGYTVLAEPAAKMAEPLQQLVQAIAHALHFTNGAMHLELRLSKQGWKLIEINPRISGGAMNKMLEAAFGINVVKETIKLLLGEKPDFTPKHRHYVYTKYLVVENKGILLRVTGRNKASQSPHVQEVYIKPRRGTMLLPPLSMGHRYAYIIATGKSKHDAKRHAHKAAKHIHFHIKVT